MKSGTIIFFKMNGEPNYIIALKEEYLKILDILHHTKKPKISDVFVIMGFYASHIPSSRRNDFPAVFEDLKPQTFDQTDESLRELIQDVHKKSKE